MIKQRCKIVVMLGLFFSVDLLHSMQIGCAVDLGSVPVHMTQCHLDQFVEIAKKNTPFFTNGADRIRKLAEVSPTWRTILDNQIATGKLIEHAYNCGIWKDKVRMAVYLGTPGACDWCKDYLLTHEKEKISLGHDLIHLTQGIEPDVQFTNVSKEERFRHITTLLKVGIDIKRAEHDVLESDVQCTKANWQPVLICATKQMNVDLVKLLLAYNANPNVITKKHQHTPLMIAMKRFHQADTNKEYKKFYKSSCIAQMLISHENLDIEQRNGYGKKAFDYANEYHIIWLQAELGIFDIREDKCTIL